MYKNLILYYFSGTGNSMTVAHWIAEQAKQRGLNVFIFSIDRFKNVEIPDIEGKSLIGFCYPTHGFSIPWLMMKFMFKFPKNLNANIFFLNTRAGFKLYHYHICGISGIAHLLAILIFWLKKYEIVGTKSSDMPQSWISVSPPNGKKAIKSIVANCKRNVVRFTNSLLDGDKYYGMCILSGLLLGIPLFPIIVGYFFIGRFFLSKTLFASYKCNACKICEQNCPVNAIKIKSGKPFWSYNCESCMRCMNICPQKSIQAWFSRIALIYAGLFSLPFYGWILVLSEKINLSASSLNKDIVEWIVFLLLFFLIFIIYIIIFKLLTIKQINKVFTFTSLTRYWNRYLSPEIKISEFKKEKI